MAIYTAAIEPCGGVVMLVIIVLAILLRKRKKIGEKSKNFMRQFFHKKEKSACVRVGVVDGSCGKLH
jgi:hypothetical protein